MSYDVRHTFSSLRPDVLRKYLSTLFVETGTNTGYGVRAAIGAGFPEIATCENDPALFRLREALWPRDFVATEPVKIDWWFSPSPAFLRGVLEHRTEPATIYLDAHSAAHNPLLDELAVLRHVPCRSHTILIDDVRMFGTPAWHRLSKQSALDALAAINPDYRISYEDTNHGVADLLVARP